MEGYFLSSNKENLRAENNPPSSATHPHLPYAYLSIHDLHSSLKTADIYIMKKIWENYKIHFCKKMYLYIIPTVICALAWIIPLSYSVIYDLIHKGYIDPSVPF